MISKIWLLVLVALCNFASITNGQECVANQVLNLRIAANAELSWEVDPNEPCEIDEFQVDIVGDRDDEYHFKVNESLIDVSFLEICEEWQFIVTPISDGVLGYERRLTENVPLPPFADISLKYFYITQIDVRDVLLEWDLMNHTHGDCTLRYRVTIEDTANGDMQDIYVNDRSVHLHLLSPCVEYHLTVRAVNRAHPTIEGPRRFHDYEIAPEPEEAPRLRTVEIGTTTIDMTWRLENAGRNRCQVRALHVDGGNFFNVSVPIVDTPERPPVEVNLKGLRPNSMYYFRVSVENSGGISQATPIAVQTLELNPGK